MGKEQSFNVTNMRNFFSKDNMEKLFENCPVITLKKNDALYTPDQILTDVFWVSEGMVEVFITNEQGQKQVVAFHYPDSIVGEIEALYGDPCRLACIALKNHTVVHKCNIEVFYNRVLELGLMRQYVSMLAGKTHTNVLQLATVALDDCEGRVRTYYNSELTHQQLAELLVCSRVQVTRVLNNPNFYNKDKDKDKKGAVGK